MNAILPLHFGADDVRLTVIDGEPWWVGADLVRLLEITNSRQALARLEDYERGVYNVDTLGGEQEMVIVNESGVYSLLLTSRKPVAKIFKRWLTVEVLPAIRKFGTYPAPDLAELEDSDRWDGYETTLAARFQEERLLWEERHGRPFVGSAPVFTKQIVAAIERGGGKIKTADRLWTLIVAEMDVCYIVTGRRMFSTQERRSIYRARALPSPVLPLLSK